MRNSNICTLAECRPDISGGGVSSTNEHCPAAWSSNSVTCWLLALASAGTVNTTRVMGSLSDQLMNCSMMKALLGTMISLRSQSEMVVARVLIRVMVPVRSRMVTVSPMRIGFSNRMIRPEMKLPKISETKAQTDGQRGHQPL